MSRDISFAFWGTPEIASKTLATMIENDLIPKIIITSPDKPKGRGLLVEPTPVKMIAMENNIPVIQPEKIDDEFVSNFSKYDIDLNIVVAYGFILPESVINTPKHGTINIHYSLLPKYRGASPVEGTLLNGESVTGVTIQKMVKKMDAGPILSVREIDIDPNTTKEELKKELIKLGAELLIETLPKYINGEIEEVDQDENKASYSGKIKKEDGEIDLHDDPKTLYNKYRAYSGWPGIYFFLEKDGKKTRIKVTKASFRDNKFNIEKVIPEGKKEMNYDDLVF